MSDPYLVDDEDLPPVPDTPMWLSHHWPWDYDRCAVIKGRHVCRRCLWMYSTAIVAGIVGAYGYLWPHRLDAWFIWLLPLPGVVDFIAEHRGWARYSPSRQVVTSVVGAVAAGRGYLRYLDDHLDHLVWGVVWLYGGICLLSAVIPKSRSRRNPLPGPE